MAAAWRSARAGQAASPTRAGRMPDRDSGGAYRPPAACRKLPLPWRHESGRRSTSPSLSPQACAASWPSSLLVKRPSLDLGIALTSASATAASRNTKVAATEHLQPRETAVRDHFAGRLAGWRAAERFERHRERRARADLLEQLGRQVELDRLPG